MKIGRKRLVIAAICLGAGICIHAQSTSVRVILEGNVYDEAGNPVGGARIDLLPLQTALEDFMPSALTDEHGHFRMTTPTYGRTRVSASKISAGFPDTNGKLFSSQNDAAPVVNLNGSQPVNEIDIHLGPPDGRIDGVVINKSNGDIVRSAWISMRWTDDPSAIYSGRISSGEFQYALPQHAIVLTITAPGFKPWVYINEETKDRFVDIAPGERLAIKAELEPTQAP
jgi:hypothetical protein